MKKKSIFIVLSTIIIIITLGICLGPQEIKDNDKKEDISVAATLTGNERVDIGNVGLAELNYTGNKSDTYATKFNKWFWNFVNVPGQDNFCWSAMPELTKTGAWCYMFLGWCANEAGCKLTVWNDVKGVYVDGRNARAFEAYNEYNTKEKYPNWFTVNNRKRNISTTSDVVNYGEVGDFVFVKGTGELKGYNHVFVIVSNDGTTVKTVEGNVYEKVTTRNVVKDGSTTWYNHTFACICKPMYRATATFMTNGGNINGMPTGWEKVSSGGSGSTKYYQYKFFDDIEAINGVQTSLPSAAQVSKSNANFQGWYTDASYSGGAVTKTNAKQRGNITYYAKWSDIEYSVTLVPNGGTIAPGADIGKYKSGTVTNLPDSYQISRLGYTFEGWFEDYWCTGVKKTRIEANESGDKVYYAKWTPNVYSVVLYPNGGTIKNSANVTKYTYGVGSKLPTASEVTKTGHTFKGWFDNPGLTGSVVTHITASDTGNKKYYAKWTPNVYSVKLHPEGGTILAGKNVTKYTYGVGAKLPTGLEILKSGCEFGGWYANIGLSDGPYTSISKTDLGNKEYWANWITFDMQPDKNIIYVYGLSTDYSVFEADKVGFAIKTLSKSKNMTVYFTEGESPRSTVYEDSTYKVKPNVHYDLPVPYEAAEDVASNRNDLPIYLQLETQATGYDGEEYYTYTVYNRLDFVLRFVAAYLQN